MESVNELKLRELGGLFKYAKVCILANYLRTLSTNCQTLPNAIKISCPFFLERCEQLEIPE